jgi:hypothetical protein
MMCLEEFQKFTEKKNLKGDNDVENQKENGTKRMKLRSSLFCDVTQPYIPEERSPKLRTE